MKFYVARHGQTNANYQKIMVGREDTPLNETGYAEAEVLAERIKDIDLTAIYTSQLVRTIDTAKIVNQYHNAEILPREVLSEIDVGDACGRYYNDPYYGTCRTSLFDGFPNGESNADVIARVYPFIRHVLRGYIDDATLLIVTHGGVCRVINSFFKNVSIETFLADEWTNCELRVYEVDTKNKRWR